MTATTRTPHDTPTLDALQPALDRGDMAEVRRQLGQLSEYEHERLRLDLGDVQYEMVCRLIDGSRGGSPAGHVVVLHGIMGGSLAVQKGTATDKVWIHFSRLAKGRMAELRLDVDGAGAKVVVTGLLKKYYLPMLLTLDEHWNVLPFAYDWREDIAASARRLAEAVQAFADGKPVHLIGHAMGGLVARAMMHLYPDLWRQIADGNALVRGGRLIMLGTPNHGAFAVPMAMSGTDKHVRLLAKIDLKHKLAQLLAITNSFPGSYQMLPSPLLDLGDDHGRLFDVSAWGAHPVNGGLLERAGRFHDELRSAIDPQRFVCVAGQGRKTPHRIQIDAPGEFSYQLTRDGDGRVAHELGLLDDVPTFFSDAAHGDLARDADVLGCIDELLETGQTTVLPSSKTETRAASDDVWYPAADFERIDNDIEQVLERENRSADRQDNVINSEERQRIENVLLEDYLGHTRGARVSRQPARQRKPKGAAPKLRVEVVWGDITRCEGQVYMVGHYLGVLPQMAERAIDAVISNDPDGNDLDRHMLRQHTLRGTLRGELGDVNFFPWCAQDGPTRIVAVAGMGRIGSFTPAAMRTLSRKLAWAVAGLQNIDTVCTVLIGSGNGTLSVEEALNGLVLGMADALRGELAETSSAIRTVRVVELYRDRAQQIYDYLQTNSEKFRPYAELDMPADIIRGDNATISAEDGLGLMLETLLKSMGHERGHARRDQFEQLLAATARGQVPKGKLRDALERAAESRKTTGRAPRALIAPGVGANKHEAPFRLSYLTEYGDIRAAAISDTATVSERVLKFDRRLIEEISAEVMDAEAPLRDTTPDFLAKLVVPQEFRDLIDRGASFVFEVDRDMAQIPWEILASGTDIANREPLAVRARVARQMRTTYSGGPITGEHRRGNLRALIVGDPGDPASGDNLPGAQKEAIAVYDLLSSRGVDVELLLGAPGARRSGRLRDFPAAGRVLVLEKLMLERYDILHYCGHGDFDEKNATRAGWVFADGLLTAYELERVTEVPGLVVANACLSGRTSQRASVSRRVRRLRDEAALLPSLADEFFKRGVINYVGTAWEVSDEGAVLFAKKLYEELLPGAGAGAPAHGEPGEHANRRASATVGDAVFAARKVLYNERDSYGKLWAAYQHYGDPTSPLSI